jgi:hypothetical protein
MFCKSITAVAIFLTGFFLSCTEQPPVPELPDVNTFAFSFVQSDFDHLIENCYERGEETEIHGNYILRLKQETLEGTCRMRIHGGTSRNYPKKSFRIYFNDNGLTSFSLFAGFPAYNGAENNFSELVLNANAIDLSVIRNYLSLRIIGDMGGIVPRMSFLKVAINNEPYGLYSILERIDEEMISKMLDHREDDHDEDDDDKYDICKAQGGTMKPTDIEKDTLPWEISEGDEETLLKLITWIDSDSFSYHEAKELFDMNTVLTTFIGCLYTDNQDVFNKNYYLICDNRNDISYFIPWDWDATFGSGWNGFKQVIGQCICPVNTNGLYLKLNMDDEWKADLKQKTDEMFLTILNENNLLDLVDSLENALAEPAQENGEIWNEIFFDCFTRLFCTGTDCEQTWSDTSSAAQIWNNEIELIRTFIESRRDVVYNAIAGL